MHLSLSSLASGKWTDLFHEFNLKRDEFNVMSENPLRLMWQIHIFLLKEVGEGSVI